MNKLLLTLGILLALVGNLEAQTPPPKGATFSDVFTVEEQDFIVNNGGLAAFIDGKPGDLTTMQKRAASGAEGREFGRMVSSISSKLNNATPTGRGILEYQQKVEAQSNPDKLQTGYLISRSETFIHHYEGSPCGLFGKKTCDIEEIRYTFSHKGIKIVADCQSWDSSNKCGKLQVGETYKCSSEPDAILLSCIDNGTLHVEFAERK